MSSAGPPSEDRIWAAALTLAVDDATARIVSALRSVGVRPILLKGPAIAQWLYEEDEVRPYGDIDLLVSPEDLGPAEELLEQLGFRNYGYEGVHRLDHADTWIPEAGQTSIDLHRTLLGATAPPERVWETLSGDTKNVKVGGRNVEALSPAGGALHIALHAAQHGAATVKTLNDLERAVTRLPDETWQAAAALADELDAVEAFGTGLRLLPEGKALAERLEVSRRTSVDALLMAEGDPAVARGIERLANTPGLSAKLRLLVRKLFPEPSFMRAWSRMARSGPPGLALSYLMRPLWLLWRAVPAGIAWRRARHEAGTRDDRA
jgi:hypothetical protein